MYRMAPAAPAEAFRPRPSSPAGISDKGTTPEGIFDLGGSVREWTCTDYHAGQVRGDFDFDPLIQKLLDEKKLKST